MATTVAAVVMLVGAGLLFWRLRRTGWGLVGHAALVLVAGLLTFMAGQGAELFRDGGAPPRLLIALDASDSLFRDTATAENLREKVSALDEAIPEDVPLAAMRFASLPGEAGEVDSIVELARLATSTGGRAVLGGDGSDLSAVIEAALDQSGEQAPQAMLLVSDGLQTSGDALAAARLAGRRGLPVHVLPVEAGAPGLGIYAARLAIQSEIDARTVARLVLVNESSERLQAGLQWGVGSDATSGVETIDVPPGGRSGLQMPIIFRKPGLQPLTVQLNTPGGASQQQQLYTLVAAPPRVLVIGDGEKWARLLPRESFEILRWQPGFPLDLRRADLVLIDGVRPDRLQPDDPDRLVAAVQRAGIGLLLINGLHTRAADEPTTLMAWEETSIKEIMPVSTNPRIDKDQLPPRDITIMVDTSGSMGGGLGGGISALGKGKEIANTIIDRMTDRDRLTIYAFAGSARRLLNRRQMDARGKEIARAEIGAMRAAGGTSPNTAFAAFSPRGECGLFFISDGVFSDELRQPGCHTTVFNITANGSVNPRLQVLGEVHNVAASFDPSRIRLGFFDPDQRKKFWEEGDYLPDWIVPEEKLQPPRPLTMNGNAIVYGLKRTERHAVRPWPTDPVLTSNPAGRGQMMVYAGGLTSNWLSRDGAIALNAWLDRLTAWSERERYLFRVQSTPGRLHLSMALTAKGGQVPQVSSLEGEVLLKDGSSLPVDLRPDATEPGSFVATILPPRLTEPVEATLVLKEIGPDALPVAQRIPIVLAPPVPGAADASIGQGGQADQSAPATAAWQPGLNAELLSGIAAASGGLYNPGPETLTAALSPDRGAGEALWRLFASLAALFYLAAIALFREVT
ncbi:MAG: hypothetical protein Alpg2KO_08450 [Alphaproteobacteria bacterium]